MQINLNLVEAKVQTFYSESSCVWDANWSMLVAEAELLKLSSYGVWWAIETIFGSSGVVH